MKRITMRNTLILLLLLAEGLLLSGCSASKNYLSTFRNRENDYIHQQVMIRAPLKTPASQSVLKLNPSFPRPKTAVTYPAKPDAPSLLPPTLAKK